MIVSDSSPLISLSFVGQLNILRHLYGVISISQAVWDEVVVAGKGEPGAEEVECSGWIERRTVKNRDLINALHQELDLGEAESIALAIQEKAEFVLMDDKLGREVAFSMKVKCIGLLGILREAKTKHLIDTAKPIVDALIKQTQYRISDELYSRFLSDVNEPRARNSPSGC